MPISKISPKVIALLALMAAPVWGATSPVSTTIEPIIGYERVIKNTPTFHTKDRLVYGGRVTVGLLLLSVETEYLRSSDSEDYPAIPMSTKDTTDKLRLGLRSNISLLSMLRFSLRVGGQASRNIHEETVAGLTTRTTDPITYRPYAGAGLRVMMGSRMSISTDITTVFNNFPNMNNNEYQVTSGIAIDFP